MVNGDEDGWDGGKPLEMVNGDEIRTEMVTGEEITTEDKSQTEDEIVKEDESR